MKKQVFENGAQSRQETEGVARRKGRWAQCEICQARLAPQRDSLQGKKPELTGHPVYQAHIGNSREALEDMGKVSK